MIEYIPEIAAIIVFGGIIYVAYEAMTHEKQVKSC